MNALERAENLIIGLMKNGKVKRENAEKALLDNKMMNIRTLLRNSKKIVSTGTNEIVTIEKWNEIKSKRAKQAEIKKLKNEISALNKKLTAMT